MAFAAWVLRRRKATGQDPSSPHNERLRELKRSKDIGGLIALLKESDRHHKNAVAEALKEVTGRDLGTKARIWQRWHHARRDSNSVSRSQWTQYIGALLKVVALVGLVKGLCRAGQRWLRQS